MSIGPQATAKLRRLFVGALTAAILAAYPAVGLYPYRWQAPNFARNGAAAIPQVGLRFAGQGIARTNGPPDWIGTAIRTNHLKLDLRVRPSTSEQRGPARIMTLSLDPSHRNFTVGQEGPDLVFRLRTPRTDLNGIPATRVVGVFRAPDWVNLGIVMEPDRLTIEINGKETLRWPLPAEPFATWDRSYRLALGNELTLDRPWLGEIRRAAVHTEGTDADYAAPGLLTLPLMLWRLDPPPRVVPLRDLELRDALVNLLGFMPLGLLFGAWPFGRLRAAYGFLFVVLTSGALETLQFFVPERIPSVDDLLLNAVGGGMGLLAARLVRRRYRVLQI